MASKPGTCVKVLTIEPPPADPRLRADMALLADCALPPELRVLKDMPAWWAGGVSRDGAVEGRFHRAGFPLLGQPRSYFPFLNGFALKGAFPIPG